MQSLQVLPSTNRKTTFPAKSERWIEFPSRSVPRKSGALSPTWSLAAAGTGAPSPQTASRLARSSRRRGIWDLRLKERPPDGGDGITARKPRARGKARSRSEEHTSELQSRLHLV